MNDFLSAFVGGIIPGLVLIVIALIGAYVRRRANRYKSKDFGQGRR